MMVMRKRRARRAVYDLKPTEVRTHDDDDVMALIAQGSRVSALRRKTCAQGPMLLDSRVE
jgi:hypothetical protein